MLAKRAQRLCKKSEKDKFFAFFESFLKRIESQTSVLKKQKGVLILFDAQRGKHIYPVGKPLPFQEKKKKSVFFGVVWLFAESCLRLRRQL